MPAIPSTSRTGPSPSSPPRCGGTASFAGSEIGGTLRSRKGINLPHDTSSLPALTDKDRADLADIGVLSPDFVALSYVRHERDIADARALTDLPLVAKIEKQQALEATRRDHRRLRRDHGGARRSGRRARRSSGSRPPRSGVIRAANQAGRPVITATQMLVSMVTNPLPTRAEVTDVANAVLDGTDAVMLSEETAIGHDPPGVVQMMTRLLAETEPMLAAQGPERASAANALAHAVAELADDLGATAVVVPTRTGVSAQCLAAFRPHRPILAYSRVPATTRRLQLAWGVRADRRSGARRRWIRCARRSRPRASRCPPDARVVFFDIGAPGSRDVPSVINTITF